MQRTVLEEQILDEHTIDIGVDALARFDEVTEMLVALYDNQGTDLTVRHILTSTHQRQPILLVA